MTKKINPNHLDQQYKECFIITPIGAPESEIFKKTEGLISSVLRPVLEEFGFIPMPAHHIDNTGSINKQIIEKIVNSELVIANLTGINPNVMYELAIRHSFGKRVITVAEYGTKLPFDILDQRTIFYNDTMHGVEQFKPDLKKMIMKCLDESIESQNISNPVYDALKLVAEINNLPVADRDALQIIISKLNDLTSINKRNRNLNLYALEEVEQKDNYIIEIKSNSNESVKYDLDSFLSKTKKSYDIEIDREYIKLIVYQFSETELNTLLRFCNTIAQHAEVNYSHLGGI